MSRYVRGSKLWNLGKFCSWNPESLASESGAMYSSRNPEYYTKDWNAESKFHGY